MSIPGSSVVRLRPLAIRPEGDEWVIGCVATGDFIIVPPSGHRVVELLAAGHSVDRVTSAVSNETGVRYSVSDFVEELDKLGFVEAVNGQVRQGPDSRVASLPWLSARHVRWLLHPSLPWGASGAALALAVLLLTRPGLAPRYSYLSWGTHPGVALAADAAICWILVLLHELAHLGTARAAGAPSRITLGTRLQFLVVQTDVSSVWAAPRKTRMTVYLAGIATNVIIALSCLAIVIFADPSGIARQLLTATSTQALLALPFECLVFMRTDLYFVLQDLSGCANLYSAGGEFGRYLLARHFRLGSSRKQFENGEIGDPSASYPHRQRLAIRSYSILLVAGTIGCIAIALGVSLPALVTFLWSSIRELVHGPWLSSIDGALTLIILLTIQILWAWRWWHQHAAQVLPFLSRWKEVITWNPKSLPSRSRPTRPARPLR